MDHCSVIRMPRPIAERRQTFCDLHKAGCFVVPNPWDVGSAKALQSLGFKALATTSAGFAWAQGHVDKAPALTDVIAHLRQIAAAVDLPITADFEDGFGAMPEDVAASVMQACDAGVAGVSIEDYPRSIAKGAALCDLQTAVNRLRAARKAMDRAAPGAVLTARSDGFITGHPDLDETCLRLAAFADAGADCLYAPGIRDDEQIKAVIRAVAPKPVNVLAIDPSMTVAGLAALGVRRISLGGSLARAAWGEFLRVAEDIAAAGRFARLAEAAPTADIVRRIKD